MSNKCWHFSYSFLIFRTVEEWEFVLLLWSFSLLGCLVNIDLKSVLWSLISFQQQSTPEIGLKIWINFLNLVSSQKRQQLSWTSLCFTLLQPIKKHFKTLIESAISLTVIVVVIVVIIVVSISSETSVPSIIGAITIARIISMVMVSVVSIWWSYSGSMSDQPSQKVSWCNGSLAISTILTSAKSKGSGRSKPSHLFDTDYFSDLDIWLTRECDLGQGSDHSSRAQHQRYSGYLRREQHEWLKISQRSPPQCPSK